MPQGAIVSAVIDHLGFVGDVSWEDFMSLASSYRFLAASQAGLTPRLTLQESLDPEDLSQVHDVVGVDPPS
jgi:hypothetical protein